MTQVTIEVDAKRCRTALTALERDQLPFAVSLFLNNLAIEGAEAQRAHMLRTMVIRSKTVLPYGIVRTEKATKRKWESAVGVNPLMAKGRGAFSYFNKFETGETKTPIRGSTVAVPGDVRRNKRDMIGARDRIQALKLAKGKGGQIGGERGTFLVKVRRGRLAGLILQRLKVGGRPVRTKGAGGKRPRTRSKVLYALFRSVPTPKILNLVANVTKAVSNRAQATWDRALTQAMATARK